MRLSRLVRHSHYIFIHHLQRFRLQAYKANRQLYNRFSQAELEARGGDTAFRSSLTTQLQQAISTHPDNENFHKDPIPKIYYASRTHSQLSQSIQELKNTAYKSANVCVLGARTQMCVNEQVTKHATSNAACTAMCRNLVSKKACSYHLNVNSAKNRIPDGQVMDIEELIEFGKESDACPYYLSRVMQEDADIVFLPYNYLLDPNSRAAQNIKVDNCIIIFDEAHNLESSCGEISSFELTTDDLSACIKEAELCSDLAKNKMDVVYTSESFFILKAVLVKFDTKLRGLQLGHNQELIKPGNFIFDFYNEIDVTFDNIDDLTTIAENAVQLLSQESSMSRQPTKCSLNLFVSSLQTVFNRQNHDDGSFSKSFKVYITNSKPTHKSRADRLWVANESTPRRTLSFWCFNSGVAMKALLKQGCRSVVLTSGTLAPLESFAAELGIPFPHCLENPHIIGESQLFVSVVAKGPSGVSLNSSFKNRTDDSYTNELGNTLVNFSRIIPDGLLVFFPAYGVMENCVQRWQRKVQTIIQTLSNLIEQ